MSNEKMWDDEAENADPGGMTSDDLDNLVHTLTARRLVEALQQPNPTPGMLQAALRFLKDNNIVGLPVPGTAARELQDRLGDSLPFKYTGTED